MIQTYSDHLTQRFALSAHSCTQQNEGGSQQVKPVDDYRLLFKDEFLNPIQLLYCHGIFASLPEFTSKSSAIASKSHDDRTMFHFASAFAFSALKTLARKLSNAPTISQSLDA